MRLLLLQQRHKGPWKWAITDAERRVIARSPVTYTFEGKARDAMLKAVRRMNRLADEKRIEVHESVQLELFTDETIGRGGHNRRRVLTAC